MSKTIEIDGHTPMVFPDSWDEAKIGKAIDQIILNEKMIEGREKQTKVEGSPLKRFFEGLYSGVKGAASGMADLGHGAVDPTYTMTAIKNAISPSIDQAKQAVAPGMSPMERFGHGLAAIAPGGPMAADIGETAGSGNVAGAAGKASTPLALSLTGAVAESPKMQGAAKGAIKGGFKALAKKSNKLTGPVGGAMMGESLGQATGHPILGPVAGMALPAIGGALKGMMKGAEGKPLLGPVTRGSLERLPVVGKKFAEKFAAPEPSIRPAPTPVLEAELIDPEPMPGPVPPNYPSGYVRMPDGSWRVPQRAIEAPGRVYDAEQLAGDSLPELPPNAPPTRTQGAIPMPGPVDPYANYPPGTRPEAGSAQPFPAGLPAPSAARPTLPAPAATYATPPPQTGFEHFPPPREYVTMPQTRELPPGPAPRVLVPDAPVATQPVQAPPTPTAPPVETAQAPTPEAPVQGPQPQNSLADAMIHGSILDKNDPIPSHVLKAMADELGVSFGSFQKHLESHGFTVESKFAKKTSKKYGFGTKDEKIKNIMQKSGLPVE